MQKEASGQGYDSYYTALDVSNILGIPPPTIYEFLNSGRIRGIRIGRRWRISSRDIEAFVETCRYQPSQERDPIAPV